MALNPLNATPLTTQQGLVLNSSSGAAGSVGSVVPSSSGGVASPGWYYNADGVFASDGTYNRVQIGDLASYTDPNGVQSPAEWGIRTLDQAGGIIFDSIGIAQVASTLADVSGSVSFSTSSTSPVTIPGTTSTVTLDYQTRVLGLLYAQGYANSQAGWVAQWSDGTLIGGSASVLFPATGLGQSQMGIWCLVLPAGSYDFALQGFASAGGGTVHVTYFTNLLISLGRT